MPTTTLKPKTTKGGSATKPSLTNASAEKSRKMLEQMLAKKLSSSTKVPKTMTIKTGATKKSTATRSAGASAGATKGRKGGRRGGNSPEAAEGQPGDTGDTGEGQNMTDNAATAAAEASETNNGPPVPEEGATAEEDGKNKAKGRWQTAAKTVTAAQTFGNAAAQPNSGTESMTFRCDRIDTQAGGYRKKGTPVKKSSCGMSSKTPMSAKPTKKSSCGTVSAKKKTMSVRPKTAKK